MSNSIISTTHQEEKISSYEKVSQVDLSAYDINKIIEVLLFASCTSVTSEWDPEECVYFLRTAERLKKHLEELKSPLQLNGIKLFLDEENLEEDPWIFEVVGEFGEHIETWIADPKDKTEPCCGHQAK